MASLNSPRTTADMEEILKTAAERAIRYVQMARERKVAPAEKDLAALTTFHEPFPAEGSNPADVVAMLDEFGSPATVATTGGRYFGFVTGDGWRELAGRSVGPKCLSASDVSYRGGIGRCDSQMDMRSARPSNGMRRRACYVCDDGQFYSARNGAMRALGECGLECC